jgi:hypothetical protein
MITLLATAALLSCAEAKSFINRIPPISFSNREYIELIHVIQQASPALCFSEENSNPIQYQRLTLDSKTPFTYNHRLIEHRSKCTKCSKPNRARHWRPFTYHGQPRCSCLSEFQWMSRERCWGIQIYPTP